MALAAWKMVDAEHAHFIESGSLRIGTFEHYRNLENGRGDPLDSAIHLIQDDKPFLPELDEDARLLRALGIGRFVDSHNVVVTNQQIITSWVPSYVFCMAAVGCRYDPDERIPKPEKAMFAVGDVKALAFDIYRSFPDRFNGDGGFGAVKYEDRELDMRLNAGARPSRYVKSRRFEPEEEIRIVLEPRERFEAEMFDTGPNASLARHFTRVY